MKLYFSPGACSLSPHIALREAGLDFETERVDLATKKTRSGEDFTAINPTGYVPALRLDNGELLTEGPAIVQYIADLVPAKQLAPAAGSFERVRLQETLNFISTELHKGFSPLFHKDCPEAWKEVVRANLGRRFADLDAQLGARQFLLGDQFTIADGYLFTVLGWTRFVNYDLAPYPNLVAYQQRVAARPAVHAALEAEGLIKRSA
jgi:glutathione S-transferase